MTKTYKNQVFKYSLQKSIFLELVLITIIFICFYGEEQLKLLLITVTIGMIWHFYLYILGQRKNRNITLTNTSIIAPFNLASREIITVDYVDIISFKKLGWFNSYGFEIIHKTGRMRISANGFKDYIPIGIIHSHLIMQQHKIQHLHNVSYAAKN